MSHFSTLFFVFGDKKLACNADVLKKTEKLADTIDLEPFSGFKKEYGLSALIFPRQVHGTGSLALIDQKSIDMALTSHHEADIISTNIPFLGIGVMTADCLPLVLYSKKKNAVAVVHAGWRGTILNTAAAAVKHLQDAYQCAPHELSVFFGPCAQVKSYEASPELLSRLENIQLRDLVLQKINGSLHFDMVRMNQLQLEEAGVLAKNCFLNFSKDMIIDTNYWSFRRDGLQSGRQLTIAFVKNMPIEDVG